VGVHVWALAAAVAFVALATIATRWGSNLRRLGSVVVGSLPPPVRTRGGTIAMATAIVGAAFVAALYVH
jgi:hypothetical protein